MFEQNAFFSTQFSLVQVIKKTAAPIQKGVVYYCAVVPYFPHIVRGKYISVIQETDMRRQLSSTLGRLVARKWQSLSAGKLYLGRSLLFGIGGATAGGLLWQYHQKGWGQTGNIFLKVRIQSSLEKRVRCHRCLRTKIIKR